MRYGNDPRSPELLCDGSGLKKQPRRLKVILSKAENTKFRLLQFGCEPLCPRFTGLMWSETKTWTVSSKRSCKRDLRPSAAALLRSPDQLVKIRIGILPLVYAIWSAPEMVS